MNRILHVVVFSSERQLMAAARECRELGMDLVDACTPYAVHGLDDVMSIRPTRLPLACLGGCLAGVVLGFWLQYFATAVDWPLNIGGKPFNSLPAFVPATFELMVLLGGLATAITLWLRSGLLPGRRPRRRLPVATDDGFALIVGHRGAEVARERVVSVFRRHGARDFWEEVEDGA